MVSWQDANQFCDRLGHLDGRAYRLPTEAEWEYACRAGTTTAFYFGDDLTLDQANFDGESPYNQPARRKGLGRTCRVGSYPPNAFGLYDVHGNVFTWCSDWLGDYPRQGVSTDPTGPQDGDNRTIRGGGWAASAHSCRSANRGRNDTTYRGYQNGVRVALSATMK
jgi:formylglycine-generating enzyme required for sulfatase activity